MALSKRSVGTKAGRSTIDGGNHRLGHRMQQRLRVMDALLAMPAIETHFACRRIHPLLHAADVATSAEALASPGEHKRFNALVRCHARQRIDELRAHVVAHGIAFVGAVESEGCHSVGDLQLNQDVVHEILQS